GRHLEAGLRERLPEWSFQTPEGGLCLWIRLPRGTARDLAMRAARQGLAIASGSIQSPQGHFGDHLRLPYGHPQDVLDLAVERLCRAWRGQPSARSVSPLDDLHVVV
ncbi:MAG TPA: hypothetical protein VMM13_10130, partial [Euzebya sp.]|nr:hypothetical protein [Euzebya sp.]